MSAEVLTAFQFFDGALYDVVGLFFVALGILISIRFAGYPDLTADGSFTVGAAVYAATAMATGNTLLALALAVTSGAVAGFITWSLNTLLGLGQIIAGVLTMIVFVLLAPYVANGATISLLRSHTILTQIADWDRSFSGLLAHGNPVSFHLGIVAFWSIVGVAATLFLSKLFHSRVGVQMRYAGGAVNPTLIGKTQRSLLLALGLGLGNAFIALGGAVEAERRGAYTANMGLGTLLIGLTILILGEAILKSALRRDYLYVGESLRALVIGSLAYGVCVQAILYFGFDWIDLRLLTTVLLTALLIYASSRYPSTFRMF